MTTIAADPRIRTKLRSVPDGKPVAEIQSTHEARCPYCRAVVRVKVDDVGSWGDVFNTCVHYAGLEQHGEQVRVEFNGERSHREHP
jgi:hypothetical protein